MIPIVLSPKYAGQRNNQNNTNNQANMNDYHQNASNQASQNETYINQQHIQTDINSSYPYNYTNGNATSQQINNKGSFAYNTQYATTRPNQQFFKKDKTNKQADPRISVSQSNLNQSHKSESSGGFFATLGGTLGRKKKTSSTNQQNNGLAQEQVRELTVQQIETEGKHAINSNTMPRTIKPASELVGGPNESRVEIDESSRNSPEFANLVQLLVNWINDELNEQRIIVRSLEADLYDGQVLGRLVEKLTGTKLDVVEFTQNEDLQKHKLRQVLETLDRILNQQAKWAQIKWSVEGVHTRNTIQIVHLLVTMIRHFRPPVRLPENVTVRVNIITNQNEITQTLEERLTEQYDETGMKVEPRDAFDTLFDHAPEKLVLVKRSLCGFVNKHLNKINIECFSMQANGDLDPNQFSDGLLLIFLMASLENYFVPLGNIFTQPADSIEDLVPHRPQTAVQYENYVNTSPIHKLHNVNVAFQLMRDVDVDVKDRVRAEDIVNADLKSTLRVLYMIYTKYKNC